MSTPTPDPTPDAQEAGPPALALLAFLTEHLPLNRVVAFFGPIIAVVAGSIATWLLAHVDVLGVLPSHDVLAKTIAAGLTFIVVTLVTWLGQSGWLKGHRLSMQVEGMLNEAILRPSPTPALASTPVINAAASPGYSAPVIEDLDEEDLRAQAVAGQLPTPEEEAAAPPPAEPDPDPEPAEDDPRQPPVVQPIEDHHRELTTATLAEAIDYSTSEEGHVPTVLAVAPNLMATAQTVLDAEPSAIVKLVQDETLVQDAWVLR